MKLLLRRFFFCVFFLNLFFWGTCKQLPTRPTNKPKEQTTIISMKDILTQITDICDLLMFLMHKI